MLSSLEVAIDRSRRDSFVTVSHTYTNSVLSSYYGGALPQSAPLRLTRPDGSDVYVGCLTQRPHNQQKLKIVFSHSLAQDLGLHEGDVVVCVPCMRAPRATKVLASPLTVDDSEVVEQNAIRIENELLRQIQVVFPEMVITVAIFAGVHAKLKIDKIETSDGSDHLSQGCAIMFEGTHFVVATRARQAESADDAEKQQQPSWAVLRALPPAEKVVVSTSAQDSFIRVHPKVAEQFHWKDGSVVGALDLKEVAALQEPKLTPAFLRSAVVHVHVTVDTDMPFEGMSGVASCVSQATNLLIVPNNGEEVLPEEEQQKHVSSPSKTQSTPLAMEELEQVHGNVPRDLLCHLKFVLGSTAATVDGTSTTSASAFPGNVLLGGGKGFGKTTIIQSVLGAMRDVHAVHLECTTGKQFLPQLRTAVQECLLCAPSVLVLDSFDNIAPDQKEGNMQAMTAHTRATLESVLTVFTGMSGCSKLVIIATCANKESVNESLRSALCFQKFLSVNPLTRTSRASLLRQMFPVAAADDVEKMVTYMENYTPFDLKQVSTRIQAEAARGGAGSTTTSLEDCTAKVTASYTPLAHAGIKFLKGEKQSWDTIGGLTDAKRVLYDTLVLPMKHPRLFERLPLKTRSGILLYGPSGCGKTFVIEALVNAENINCIVVNGPEVFGKYIGQSEQKIRDVFERAAAAAPCVIFFDEFDSVAPQRGLDNSGVTDRVVNQLLCYLDGVEGRKDVYIVAASSRPDLIDAALLRPGRLDKAVVCPIPSHADRVAMLTNLFSKTTATFDEATFHTLADETENWTPADLSAMVSTANTLVNQRMMERLVDSSAKNLMNGGGDDEPFIIANMAPGASRDKIADALKHLSPAGAAAISHHAQSDEQLTLADVKKAMATTRPSLTAKDIAKHERIHKLFSKGETMVPAQPGTKLTSS